MVKMCRQLSELLGIKDPLFGIKLDNLEIASGRAGLDVRLSAEIIGKSFSKLRELGLDPKDTTGPELYAALINLAQKHDSFLAKRLGVKDPTDVIEVLPKIKSFVEGLDIPKNTWAIKSSSAKRILKNHPPKKVMKQLGYRSIDSMLKRESVVEIMAATRFLESDTWNTKLITKYNSLSSHDFESRNVQLLRLDVKKWGSPSIEFVRSKKYNITNLKEFGAVIILPLPVGHLNGLSITVIPMLLHYINEIRAYGSFFKLQQVKNNFGQILAKTIADDTTQHTIMAGHSVHWKTIHRHFGNKSSHDLFEPHLEAEDLFWRKAEQTLYKIEPALHFWHDMDYVMMKFEDGIVSFNLIDNAVNFVNNLQWPNGMKEHARDSLWNEIFTRYMGEKSLESQIVKQLSIDGSGPSELDMMTTEFDQLMAI